MKDNLYYNNGNIGVGTINPQTKLQVVGDFRFTVTHFLHYSVAQTTSQFFHESLHDSCDSGLNEVQI